MTAFGDIDRRKLAEALQKVGPWDFSLTKEKLLEPSYAGWTIDRADAAERDYKRYMAITAALSGQQLVPNGDIDRFWHEHILDTRRYAKDCFELFGEFLHHYPYFGMRGEVDNRNWVKTAQESNDLWNREFGEELYAVPGEENAGGTPMKCPQACPNPGVAAAGPTKCPQACPNPGMAAAVGFSP